MEFFNIFDLTVSKYGSVCIKRSLIWNATQIGKNKNAFKDTS